MHTNKGIAVLEDLITHIQDCLHIRTVTQGSAILCQTVDNVARFTVAETGDKLKKAYIRETVKSYHIHLDTPCILECRRRPPQLPYQCVFHIPSPSRWEE